MDLIPAIDLIEGKVVRLSKGDYSKKIIYSDRPLDVAKQFEGVGIKRLEGAATGLYRSILQKFPSLNLIASGGVSKLQDLTELKELGCHGAIIGKAFYEGKITLGQMKTFINNN